MSRRPYLSRFECAEPGCPEVAHFESQTRAEQTETYRRYWLKWKCVRHTRANEVLSAANRKLSMTMVAEHTVEGSAKLFWGGSSGFQSGPGFKAFADDFPEGTKLIVTAEVLIPETLSGGGMGPATNPASPTERLTQKPPP